MRRRLIPLILLWTVPHFALAQGQGAAIYEARCAVCHGTQGQGISGLYPPLAGSLGRLLVLEEARAYITWVVRYGLLGPIRSGGAVYKGVMPAHPGFSVEELTALLNFLLALNAKQLPPNVPPFSTQEVGQYLGQSKTPAELSRLRETLLEKLAAKGLPLP